MNKISYSQFTMWANCPLAWELKYVHGHRIVDDSVHTIFGTSIHEVIQDWLNILFNESETKAKTIFLDDIFKEKLLALFKEKTALDAKGEKVFLCDKPTLMQFYEHGIQILSYVQTNHKKLFPTASTKLYGIEFPLDIVVDDKVQYIGFIDIVTYNTVTKKYKLYDLKTSKNGWSATEKSDPLKVGQLLLYKRFFSQQTGVPESNISVEFVILKRILYESSEFSIPRVTKFEPPNGAPSVNKAWNKLQEFINTAFTETGEYVHGQVATPSKTACRWCKFKTKKDLCSVAVTK